MPRKTNTQHGILGMFYVEESTGCWKFTGCIDRSKDQGYGRIRFQGKLRLAHRLFYEWLRAPIPEGLTLDHLCRNRYCVNPAHLEPVTQAVNSMRGVGVCAINARKTHCKYGHALTPDNLYVYPAGRVCKLCVKIRGLNPNAVSMSERGRRAGAVGGPATFKKIGREGYAELGRRGSAARWGHG